MAAAEAEERDEQHDHRARAHQRRLRHAPRAPEHASRAAPALRRRGARLELWRDRVVSRAREAPHEPRRVPERCAWALVARRLARLGGVGAWRAGKTVEAVGTVLAARALRAAPAVGAELPACRAPPCHRRRPAHQPPCPHRLRDLLQLPLAAEGCDHCGRHAVVGHSCLFPDRVRRLPVLDDQVDALGPAVSGLGVEEDAACGALEVELVELSEQRVAAHAHPRAPRHAAQGLRLRPHRVVHEAAEVVDGHLQPRPQLLHVAEQRLEDVLGARLAQHAVELGGGLGHDGLDPHVQHARDQPLQPRGVAGLCDGPGRVVDPACVDPRKARACYASVLCREEQLEGEAGGKGRRGRRTGLVSFRV
eukprot:1499637-Rhodomonas_salina.1